MNRYYHSGYAGLVAILVGTAIIAILLVKVYLTPRQENNMIITGVELKTASGTMPQTQVGRMRADINAAKAVQERLNERNRDAQRVMDEAD